MTKLLRKRVISCLFFSFILTANVAVVVAQTGIYWNVKEGETIEFDIFVMEADEVLTQGILTVEIGSLAENQISYSSAATFTTDQTNLEGELTGSNLTVNNSYLELTNFTILLYDMGAIDTFIRDLDETYELIEESYFDQYTKNTSVQYTMKQLSYGWEIKFEDKENQYSTYDKLQYNKLGLLVHFEDAFLDTEGKESSIRVKLLSYSGQSSSIPGYSSLLIFTLAISSIYLLIRRKST